MNAIMRSDGRFILVALVVNQPLPLSPSMPQRHLTQIPIPISAPDPGHSFVQTSEVPSGVAGCSGVMGRSPQSSA